jgi:hypothetical protein
VPDETLITVLARARALPAELRHDDNSFGPRRGIGNVPPVTYTNARLHGMQWEMTLCSPAGLAASPFATPSLPCPGSNEILLIPEAAPPS